MVPPPAQVWRKSQETFIGNVPKLFGRKLALLKQAAIALVVAVTSDLANVFASPCVMGGGGGGGGVGLVGPLHADRNNAVTTRSVFRMNGHLSFRSGLIVAAVFTG